MSKLMIAMILVGGKGSRLREITQDTAKPAVAFGGKYRLIDFTLSNLVSSQIDAIGLITQYEPYELMAYIGSGASWDLDVVDGGIRFLTPYSSANDQVVWQKGTAHAVKQYFRFVKDIGAEYVLILSGDQLYKMNYQAMLKHHLETHAEITIAATKVPLKDANRYGILDVSATGELVAFNEKPLAPISNLASMGLYLFNTSVLEGLLEDGSTEETVDFGENIIPKAIREQKRIQVYLHNDYWMDVGTVESLFQANMDLIDNPDFLNLNQSRNMPVYSRSLNLPPHLVEGGVVTDSIIADGSIIRGMVHHSVIGYECLIDQESVLENVVLLPGVIIRSGVRLKNAIVNKQTIIPKDFVSETEQVRLFSGEHFREEAKTIG